MMLVLRRLLIAIAALAILAAPCLSVLTPLGDTAHASHATLVVKDSGSHHDHALERAHRHAPGHDHARAPEHEPPTTPAHDQEADCCCECNGWIMAKASSPQPAVSSIKLQFDATVLPESARVSDAAARLAERSIPARGGLQSIPVSNGPVYAVTGRFRI